MLFIYLEFLIMKINRKVYKFIYHIDYMVKIALVGYGKMGHVVEKVAKNKGHEIVSIIDPNCEDAEKEINAETLKDAEICIDFTDPSAVVENIKKISSLGKNIVVGTTGWYDYMDEIKQVMEDNNTGLIWSGNFSIGVNSFFKMVERASEIINNLENYDLMVNEIHHNQKADSPSGTAKMISDILIKNVERKDKVVTDKLERRPEKEELHVSSSRIGSVPGVHSIMFDSLADTIEIKHTARTREGFGVGAIMAAEFILGKKGIYNINDLMEKNV